MLSSYRYILRGQRRLFLLLFSSLSGLNIIAAIALLSSDVIKSIELPLHDLSKRNLAEYVTWSLAPPVIALAFAVLGYLFGARMTQRGQEFNNKDVESQSIFTTDLLNKLKETLGDAALVAFIIISHGLLAATAVGLTTILKYLLTSISEGHTLQIGGVSLSYLLEGAEILLAVVILMLGVISAIVTMSRKIFKQGS